MSQAVLARTLGDDKKIIMPSVREYYGQLVGATVSEVVLIVEEWEDDKYTPVFALTTTDGNILYVEVWSDPEGNAGGHLSMRLIPKEQENG